MRVLVTLIFTVAPGSPTSGLDATGSILNSTAYPVLPAPLSLPTKLSVDAEGLVLNADGRCDSGLISRILQFTTTGRNPLAYSQLTFCLPQLLVLG